MTKLATFGLLATSGIGQALAAPLHARGLSPSPSRQPSRVEQDMAEAMDLVRRGEDAYASVDWSKVDYSGVDYSKVDWTKINYDRGDVRGDSPAAPSPTLSSLGRAYEQTFGEPSPLHSPQPSTTLTRGFSPTLPPMLTATPVPTATPAPAPAPVIKQDAPAAQAPFRAPSPKRDPAAAPKDALPINFFAGIDAKQNAVAVAWYGQGEMTFSFFANAGPYQPNLSKAYKSVTLQPGKSETVQLPEGWSGRVQKMTGGIDSDATWAELTFDGWQGLTWFDDSYIRGYNGPVEMYLASTPEQKAGSRENMLSLYPKTKQTMQPRGSAIPATEGYDGTIHFDIIDFWRAHNKVYPATATAPERLEAYIVNNDDKATWAGKDKHLVTAWY